MPGVLSVLLSSVAFRTGLSEQKVKLYTALAGLMGLAVYFLRSRGLKRGKMVYKFVWDRSTSNAGDLVGECLKQHGVKFVYTLCGGHVSPILVGSKKAGIRVIDVRHEATAAFAAEATSRLTGVPGVCVVTAGPGLTNTLTAIKNAELSQTPLILLGGATSDLLKGRHSLQDIDQMAVFRPHCKFVKHISRVEEILPSLEEAFMQSMSGTPGPVFVEFPIDTLYQESLTRDTVAGMIRGKSLVPRMLRWGVSKIINRIFTGLDRPIPIHAPMEVTFPKHSSSQVAQVVQALKKAKKPMLVLGSQSVCQGPEKMRELVAAVTKLGIPVWLQGMCRGLLGKSHRLYVPSNRNKAFSESDCVLISGVPFDFRTNYGLSIPMGVFIASVNRNLDDLQINRDFKMWTAPSVLVNADPADFLIAVADKYPSALPSTQWDEWIDTCSGYHAERMRKNALTSEVVTDFVNPVKLCMEINNYISDDATLIGDGGDFVATVAYNVNTRKPLGWMTAGLYGTLGAGAGYALAAKLVNPGDEVVLFWGDGSCGYSVMDFDTFRRFETPVVAIDSFLSFSLTDSLNSPPLPPILLSLPSFLVVYLKADLTCTLPF
eukprot:TRINITY_DN873_c0_g1_i2.p1 TRINITY_DN873_c0_g1~~TRINITY_DN873_c0_g1_i2.p1  ORF type:complete len:629 (+),score=128.83 TRINITY_DN873_c0_g1_i2:82-1887(+)